MFSALEEQAEQEKTMIKTGSEFIAPKSIPITLGTPLRSGVPILGGFMPAGILVPDNYVIPTYDPRTSKGYQRPSQDNRVNELVADLRKQRVDLPTSVLLNIRGEVTISDDELVLEDENDNPLVFHVVDGQHRVLALKKLIEEDGLDRWGNFPVPFTCMIGANEPQEMEQFYIVNSRAKSVRTDLAYALLRKLSERDAKMLERLEEKGRDWQIAAQKLVEALAKDSQVWRNLIRLPAMEKGSTTMPSASMVTSLKPLLQSAFFGRLSFEKQLQVLDAFWRGLREVMRPAFDDPRDYVVQKGVGVIVMHAVLVDLLELIRSSGGSTIEPEGFSELMRGPAQQLSGEAQDGTPVSGIDFWRVAPQGAGGSYSSSAGRRLLIAKMRQLLPHVEAA